MATPQEFFDPFFLLDQIHKPIDLSTGRAVTTLPEDWEKHTVSDHRATATINPRSFLAWSALSAHPFTPATVAGSSGSPLILENILKPLPDSSTNSAPVNGFEDVILPTRKKKLPITGQGTIAVKSKIARDKLIITALTDPDLEINGGAGGGAASSGGRLDLHIGKDSCKMEFTLNKNEIPYVIPDAKALKGLESCYLEEPNYHNPINYWLSIDQQNGILRYGKYYTSMSLTLLEVELKHKVKKDGAGSGSKKNEALEWKNHNEEALIKSLKHVLITEDGKDLEKPIINVHPCPIVLDVSPFVLPSDKITLLQLEDGTATSPANLPQACQTLYGNVAGANITLDDDDFPDFTAAIQYSCTHEDGWCYKMLKEKFDRKPIGGAKDRKENYLRITIGHNQGDSPGIPYVLEIWPSGCCSPVHNHGNACAIIKILHGKITATYYDTLEHRKPALVGNPAYLKKGDITWLGPNNYQIHKLENASAEVCCTIQCYKYEDKDKIHYEYFDLRTEEGLKKNFEPDSDMAFGLFREKMKGEWAAVMAKGKKEWVGIGKDAVVGANE